MFCVNRNGIPTDLATSKIKYCKIWDNGTLVRDMVSCKRDSDGELGMYDKVNNVFYTNLGTGKFTMTANLYYYDGTSWEKV